MNLEQLQKNWNDLGTDDPCWAVLSHKDKRGNAWDPDAFFATGRELIDGTLEWVREQGVDCTGRADCADRADRADLASTSTALDFGCGAGRLTQALARHFGEVTGVDIAPSMIQVAERFAADVPNCRFVLNERADLSVFADASFDFVCSYIVLQHMEPRYAESYLREFARVLRPGGALVFQAPSEPINTWKGRLRRVLATPTLQPLLNAYKRLRYRQTGAMEMYGMPRQRVEQLLSDCGLALQDTVACDSAGPTWESYRYLAVKALAPSETSETSESKEPAGAV